MEYLNKLTQVARSSTTGNWCFDSNQVFILLFVNENSLFLPSVLCFHFMFCLIFFFLLLSKRMHLQEIPCESTEFMRWHAETTVTVLTLQLHHCFFFFQIKYWNDLLVIIRRWIFSFSIVHWIENDARFMFHISETKWTDHCCRYKW